MELLNKIAFKGFDVDSNGNLNCRGKSYKVGEIAEVDGDLRICGNGIHFCWKLNDVHDYYNLKEKVICKVEILGDVVNDEDMSKSCTNKLKVLEILTKEQVFAISNTGKDNTGVVNSGNCNSGDRNSGNYNSGNYNSGNCNSGYRNSGNYNSGNYNSGDCNSGDCNSGNCNSGYRNSGNYNSGNYNSGNCNSGNYNSGDRNSGYRNSGDRNSGYRNSGNRNSGDCNSGNYNSGNYNKTDYSSGLFCNQPEKVRLFNVATNMTHEDFYGSKYWNALTSGEFYLTEWIYYTNEEKAEDKAKELIGGYLKKFDYKKACGRWWDSLSDENKVIIQSMPNFDKDIFKDITGIEV